MQEYTILQVKPRDHVTRQLTRLRESISDVADKIEDLIREFRPTTLTPEEIATVCHAMETVADDLHMHARWISAAAHVRLLANGEPK